MGASHRFPYFSLGFLAAFAAVTTSGFAQESFTARELLRSLMDLKPKVPCTLVQLQKFDMSGSRGKFLVDLDTKGRMRCTAIAPLRIQGTFSIDDGKQMAWVMPDEKKIFFQPSMRANRADPKWRMGMIEKNYQVSFDKPAVVAGRRAFTVLASAKSPEMPSRKYWVDADSQVMLRLEVIEPDGDVEQLLDTLDISLGGRHPVEYFALPDSSGYKVENCPQFKRVTDKKAAKTIVGFAPRVPEAIPFGFAAFDMHFMGQEQATFIALRISDGLVTATVYQWDGKRKLGDFPFNRRGDAADKSGVKYMVVGEVPRTVKMKLADFFSRQIGPE